MASNYKFYEQPAVVVRSNAKSGGSYAVQRHSDQLHEKLMEAEAVLKELQLERKVRSQYKPWLTPPFGWY